MVYYGVVSKGCQRCRQRKIKCDQRRPACLKCEKSKTQCLGYRNLADVMFRDESERIIRKAGIFRGDRQAEQPKPLLILDAVSTLVTSPTFPERLVSLPASDSNALFPLSIPSALSQSINEIGAHFFFANYLFDGPPYASNNRAWLTQTYCEDRHNHALRVAIEAVGMAGISNMFHAPHVAVKSKEQYGRALAAINQALGDPVEMIADGTLMAVILLGLYETIAVESWDQFRSWTAHIKGATALLQLRGQEQFSRERGVQLYVQLRGQIMYACVQQDIPVPPALVQMNDTYKTSNTGERRSKICPGSIADMSFQLLNLRAAIKRGELTDSKTIRDAATEIDRDLDAWRADIPPSYWSYAAIDASNAPAGTNFNGKCHVYGNLWSAQVWNNWRAVRIVTNQIILQNEVRSSASQSARQSKVISLIRQLSTDICISTPSFTGSSRAVALIWTLFIVSQEELNDRSERSWAVEQLRNINASMGIRHARLLADFASQHLKVS
ncbi:hypothetical protein K469DRAFT_720220 [Zopfia rhizophila CBS 207.26]|uniref:Zn(2)-C6 fungal-type domain-containing protein n=1 Tax=Zopfia rhizophila CBS 207.26 TaxID=1314779 RepID=A0A6A6EKE3_9PEZI|nr:hypothetical protein K469DRAFT_720220 [Zopfia rhizophila CBS 207.26]